MNISVKQRKCWTCLKEHDWFGSSTIHLYVSSLSLCPIFWLVLFSILLKQILWRAQAFIRALLILSFKPPPNLLVFGLLSHIHLDNISLYDSVSNVSHLWHEGYECEITELFHCYILYIGRNRRKLQNNLWHYQSESVFKILLEKEMRNFTIFNFIAIHSPVFGPNSHPVFNPLPAMNTIQLCSLSFSN